MIFVGETTWAWLTWSLILLPGLGSGLYEILRKPMSNNTIKPIANVGMDIEQSELTNQSERGITSRHNDGLRCANFNFGLEVLPKLFIYMPKNCSILCRMCVVPFYLVGMAVWFPFLPFIQ